MNETPKTAAEDLLPNYAELVSMLQLEKSARFAELARTFNPDVDPEDAPKGPQNRQQYAGKLICAARTMWETLRQEGRSRRQEFPDYFESVTGCHPSSHGQSCAKTYRNMVLTGKIAEADYDENSSNAIEATSRIISKVDDDINHPSVVAAASILRQRGPAVIKELKALLDRLQDADLNIRPLGFSPAVELAFKIAKEGHHIVLADPLNEMAASTSKFEEARALAVAAANIRASLANNRDERGQRRFSDEVIAGWMTPEASVKITTTESLKADRATHVKQIIEIDSHLNKRGVPTQPTASLPAANPDAISKTVEPELSLKRWRAAEQRVLPFLQAKGWKVEDVSAQKLGYDIEGQTPKREDVFIEVKSIDYPGQIFTFTDREVAVARQKGSAYLLAIVRQADHHLEVALIRDPANVLKLTRQCRAWVWECAAYKFAPERYPIE